MNKAKQDTLLGVVFFAGLALLLWATYALTDLSFEEKPKIEVFADNAGGIRAGDPVFVLGNRYGQVESLEFVPDASDPNRRTKLILGLSEPLELQSDATIQIEDASLLGGKVIEIDPGTAADRFPAAQGYVARLEPNGLDALGELLSGEQLQEDFRSIITGVRNVVDRLQTAEGGTLGDLINSTRIADELTAAIESARRSLTELEKAQSPLGRLIYSDEDGQRMSAAIESFRSIGEKADTGTGLVARILNDQSLADDANRLVKDAADIVTDAKNGKGTVGRLLRDEGLADRIESMIDGFAKVADNANDPEAGLIGALLADPELRDAGSKILRNLESATDNIVSGNGLLARLINDEELGEQFSRILNQVSRAIEDAREAAPVGTFFQVLSGAF